MPDNSADRSKLTAAAAELPLGDGLVLRMSPLNDVDMAELDEWVRGQFIKNALAAAQGLPDEEWKRLMRLAMSEALTLMWTVPPGSKLVCTLEGMVRVAWQACKRNMPDLTYERLRKAMIDPQNMLLFRERFASHNAVDGGPPAEGRPLGEQRSTPSSREGGATPSGR